MRNPRIVASVSIVLGLLVLTIGWAERTDAQLEEPFSARIVLRELHPAFGGDGSIGFIIDNHVVGPAGSAGDLNGDGIDDLYIGADNGSGMSVIYGRDALAVGNAPVFLYPDDLDGSNGFRITCDGVLTECGQIFASGGDLNGDGFDDLVIGRARSLEVFVLFGRDATLAGDFPATLSLDQIPGQYGFRVTGEIGQLFGTSLAIAGDVNNDGVDDLMINIPNARVGTEFDAGRTFVLFGRTEPAGDSFEDTIPIGHIVSPIGFSIDGYLFFQHAGITCDGIGDFNGDGIDDMMLGSPEADIVPLNNEGLVYVVFGKDSQTGELFPDAVGLQTLDGSDGFRIEGVERDDHLGTILEGVGDMNGDGLDDAMVFAEHSSLGSSDGRHTVYYLYFGRDAATTPIPPVMRLSDFSPSDGMTITNTSGNPGTLNYASEAGDINGDGYMDFMMSYPGAQGSNQSNRGGQGYIVYGSDSLPSTIELNNIDQSLGCWIDSLTSLARTGVAIGYAGDLNGDGRDDVIVSMSDVSELYPDEQGWYHIFYGRMPDEPCRADVNRDGDVTPTDFTAWISVFKNDLPLCDQNNDGECSPTDFTAWIGNFSAGC